MSDFSKIEINAILDQADENHECELFPNQANHEDYGPAISHIVRVGDDWYATSRREYATPIKFCPFCGKKL